MYVSFNSNHLKSCVKTCLFAYPDKYAKYKTAILSELKTVLRNQKYPSKIIEAGIKKPANHF